MEKDTQILLELTPSEDCKHHYKKEKVIKIFKMKQYKENKNTKKIPKSSINKLTLGIYVWAEKK